MTRSFSNKLFPFALYHICTRAYLFPFIVYHKQTDQFNSQSAKMKKEDTVKLISAEGFEFIIDKKAAMVSQTIRNMLTSPGSFAETEHGEVTFPEISTTILEKICQYFYWSLQYASGKETEFHIEPEITLELMMAANYLHT
ncbi:Transcription elongation factor B polypeptide 1 [Capsicum annuum]|uniref:Elongin-C n=1 Tax=Capsicum annuum TaxID=4072 RepID=A0A1U8H2N8_CAPAN|nr:elongin-C [Capsicum annuum]XP_016577746.1 elongin-C [Capsicum annuum]KAF3668447.1 Transcription elongation factor B polypeptide 1 [Capsicum annuum]PHT80233.1 Transcription elongation factor B polypeptide 1 [Capsicum annuum]